MIISNAYNKTLIIIIFLILLNGLFVSILKFIGINLPVSLISLLILFIFPLAFYRMIKKINYHNFIKQISFLIILFSILFLSQLLFFSDDLTMSPILLTLLFIFSIYFLFLPIGLNKEETLKLLKYIQYAGYTLLFISYVQLLFHSSLPNPFVELPKISSDLVKKDYIRELEDLIIFRPNGLFANPIVFGSTLIFFYTLELYNFFKTKSKFSLIMSTLIFFMIFSLFSRANISIALIITFYFLFIYGYIKRHLVLFTTLSTIIIALFISFYERIPALKFIVDRFLEKDSHAVASTGEHISDYINAFETILQNPFFGIMMGENQKLSIITDGAWFIFLLNFGIPLFIIYITIWLLLLHKIFLLNKINEYRSFLFPYFLLISSSAFLNSFLVEKKVHVFIFFSIGILINLYIISKKETYEKT